MKNMIKTFYIDSNIFLFPVLYENDKAEKAGNILKNIENKKIIGYTSLLTWDEITYVVNKVMGKPDSILIGKKFIEYPNLRFINIDMNIIINSQEIREKYNIKPRDSIHIACAISKGINKIISDDSDFDLIDLIKRIKLE